MTLYRSVQAHQGNGGLFVTITFMCAREIRAGDTIYCEDNAPRTVVFCAPADTKGFRLIAWGNEEGEHATLRDSFPVVVDRTNYSA